MSVSAVLYGLFEFALVALEMVGQIIHILHDLLIPWSDSLVFVTAGIPNTQKSLALLLPSRRCCRCVNPASPMSCSHVWCRAPAVRAQEKCFRQKTSKTPFSLTNNLGSIPSIIHKAFLVRCHSSKQKPRLVLNVHWFSNDLRRESKQNKHSVSLD